jgi:hypothetical protein
MRQILEFIAVLSCSLFAGASVYINLVEHPARMECGVEIAATEFAPSYRRATIMQATCVVCCRHSRRGLPGQPSGGWLPEPFWAASSGSRCS